MASSVMLPTELYSKYDDNSNGNRNMRLSVLSRSSIMPKPSTSITMIDILYLSVGKGITSYLLIHTPFVHGFIVGPTLNTSSFEFNMTLFSRNDLPVRYLPIIDSTPTYVELPSDSRWLFASGFITNLLLLRVISGSDI
jgi:hypothetical protein